MDGARQDLLTFREMAACEARGDGEVVQSNPEFKEFTHVVPVLGSVSQVNEEIVGRRRGKGAVKGKRRLIGGDGVWSRSLGDVALKAPM